MIACPSCETANPPNLKFCGECGTRLSAPAPARELRKTVTVLFSDVSGSTALGERLDAEALRGLMSRYFAEIKRIIESHGGTVEKFIGDAVMAVFGVPVRHEDDALRAVRAADEIRSALARLNTQLTAERGLAIAFRTGVNTGEVVAGDPASGQTLVTGDTVNTAARLEQAAAPGEILLGEPTWRLVRDAVEVERAEPVMAKGKAVPVPAYRLLAVVGAEAHRRALGTPLVSRGMELDQLLTVYRRTVVERAAQLITVLAPAGVGKSRLVTEFVASVTDEATTLKGRCLSYGEGVTYWPLRGIVDSAGGLPEGADREAAMAGLATVLEGAPEAELLGRRLAGALGLIDEPSPQEEIFWATRKLLEHLARDRPVVVVVEDIHWAEPTFADLLEYVLDLAADAPLLLLATARPELLEKRPGWGGGRPNSHLLRLEPLAADSATQLLDVLPGGPAVPPALRQRIVTAAEGNPLFVEEMLGMLVDDGHLVQAGEGDWRMDGDPAGVAVPPSIGALLGARIDALPKEERAIAERASVVGRVFETAAVRELTPEAERGRIGSGVLALVRKELLRPERADLGTGDAFKFRHLLIRDAAYEGLPKSERSALHESFAGWLEAAAGERSVEFDEIRGYHLEQAHNYRTELGESGERVEQLARRAGELLTAAGIRAAQRDDAASAQQLLQRAVRLLPERSREAGNALVWLAYVELEAMTEPSAAARALAMGTEAALDAEGRTRALIVEAALARQAGNGDEGWIRRLKDALQGGADTLEPALLAELAQMRSAFEWDLNMTDASLRSLAEAESFARRAGDMGLFGDLAIDQVVSQASGDTPLPDVLELIDRYLEEPFTSRVHSELISERGRVLFLSGRVAEGSADMRHAVEVATDLGLPYAAAARRMNFGITLKRGEQYDMAADLIAEAHRAFAAVEDAHQVSYCAAHLAHIAAILGTTGAESFLEVAAGEPFFAVRLTWHYARARLRVRAGDGPGALAELEVARPLAEMPLGRSEYHLESAAVNQSLGLRDEALAASRAAREAAQEIGIGLFADRANAFIKRLTGSNASSAVTSSRD